MHYCVLIIIFTVDNFVMGLTLRPVEARPNRKAENGSGVIGKGALYHFNRTWLHFNKYYLILS